MTPVSVTRDEIVFDTGLKFRLKVQESFSLEEIGYLAYLALDNAEGDQTTLWQWGLDGKEEYRELFMFRAKLERKLDKLQG